MIQNLLLCFEALVEFIQINVLHGNTRIHGQAGSNARTLAHDHKHRLHSNRAIGDMRCGQAEWNEQVGTFFLFGHNGAVGDWIRLGSFVTRITFVANRHDSLFLNDYALAGV